MILILFKENVNNIIILMSKKPILIIKLIYRYQYYFVSFNTINL